VQGVQLIAAKLTAKLEDHLGVNRRHGK
jgi:hypothetical protein